MRTAQRRQSSLCARMIIFSFIHYNIYIISELKVSEVRMTGIGDLRPKSLEI